MVTKSGVEIQYNLLPRLIGALPEQQQGALRDAAMDVEAYAKPLCPWDTGATRDSILAEQVEEWAWEIGPHTDYAIYLEFGTYKMPARPYMRPAMERVRLEYPNLAMQAIVRALQGGGGSGKEWFAENAPGVKVEDTGGE